MMGMVEARSNRRVASRSWTVMRDVTSAPTPFLPPALRMLLLPAGCMSATRSNRKELLKIFMNDGGTGKSETIVYSRPLYSTKTA